MPKEKIIYYPNGAVKEKKHLVEGKLDGDYTSYFPGGQIMAQLLFNRGKRNGPAVSYFVNGQIRESAVSRTTK